MTAFPTRFESTLDLARLPWFEVRGGSRLAIAADVAEAVGPVIDMHTHLAMGYLRKLAVDVTVETPATSYYFPVTLPVDLEGYANVNFDAASLFAMRIDLSAMSLTGTGMRRTHTVPNLLRDMGDLGIARSVVLPIDWPVGPQNTDVVLDACRPHPGLVPFASVHPMRRDVDAHLERHRAAGAKGVKVHPAVQGIPPDHPRTVHLCGRCGAHGLPVLFHCGPVGIAGKGADARCQVPRYEQVIAEHPETTFVLGHSGALQMEQAVAYADRYPNTYFELASLGVDAVRTVLDCVPPDRVVYGTDWPFYHQALTLARVLIATDGDDALRRAVLHDNAARLLGPDD